MLNAANAGNAANTENARELEKLSTPRNERNVRNVRNENGSNCRGHATWPKVTVASQSVGFLCVCVCFSPISAPSAS